MTIRIPVISDGREITEVVKKRLVSETYFMTGFNKSLLSITNFYYNELK